MKKQRRVVCAAIRSLTGKVILGVRHYDDAMHAQLAHRDDAWQFRHLQGDNQGFVDQRGAYMNREEAFRVASEAGQILCPEACSPRGQLFSEDLY